MTGKDEGRGLFARLRRGLGKSRNRIVSRIRDVFGRGSLTPESVDELEEILYGADLGPTTVMEILDAVAERGRRGSLDGGDVLKLAGNVVLDVLRDRDRSLAFSDDGLTVFLVVGVNGTGKTTTIGKLAHSLRARGSRPLLAACDTFRAAAVEQLRIWSERTGSEFVGGQQGGDAAAVAFDALDAAGARGCDIVLIDSAGRLHTQSNLMEELKKLRRVVERKRPGAPHEVLLVVDATTGTNALEQARRFRDAVGVTGVVLTKLDGTSRGGIVVAIERELGIPVKLVGLGEGLDDLAPFDPEGFVAGLLGEADDGG